MKQLLVALLVLGVVAGWISLTIAVAYAVPPRGSGSGLPDLADDPHWLLRVPPNPVQYDRAPSVRTAVATTVPAPSSPRTTRPRPPPAAVSGTCNDWLAAAHVDDVGSAIALIGRESGCNPYAVNPRSGACGVAQELPCGKSGCATSDGACQVAWMDTYVHGRYGTWANALAFQIANGWY